MKPSMYYLVFGCGVAATIAVELMFNKSLRRRAAALEGKAEEIIHAGVEKTAHSLQNFSDNGFAWKVREEISDAFEHATQAIGKG